MKPQIKSRVFWLFLVLIVVLAFHYLAVSGYFGVKGVSSEVEDIPIDSSTVSEYSDLFDEDIDFPNIPEHLLEQQEFRLLFLNIHCTASRGELTKQQLLKFFREERKWRVPGYNTVVHKDGSYSTLVPFNWDNIVQFSEISNGVKGANRHSINIAYTGGVNDRLQPMDTRTPQQKASIRLLVEAFQCAVPTIQVLGHRDHPGVRKACPSFDARSEYNVFANRLPYEMPDIVWEPVVSDTEPFDTLYYSGKPVLLNY